MHPSFQIRHMIRSIVLALCGSALLLSASHRQAAEIILSGLPDRIADAIKENRLVSLSLAVVHDQQVIFCGVFGESDLERKRPADVRTIYPLASVTKLFVATMLAQLVERHGVGLDDPVRKYLPEYRPHSPYPGTPPTTLRQLAAHTSGLPEDAPVNFWCDLSMFLWLVTQGQTELTGFSNMKTLLSSLGEVEFVQPPEVYARYSNLNFQVLGLALERACKRPFAEYMKRNITAPLEMPDTVFSLSAEQRGRLARGYVFNGPGVPVLDAPEFPLGCAVYSGGLYSTVKDMARFLAFQFNEDPASGSRVLGIGALRRMRTPQSIHRPGTGNCYGLGWGIVTIGGHDAIEHNGALPGFSAHVSAIPGLKLGIVALSNSKNFLWRPDACKDFAREILAELADTLVRSKETLPFDPAGVDLSRYAGRYALPGQVAGMSISVGDRGLRTALDGTEFDEIFLAVAPDTFCFASDPAKKPMLFFSATSEGRIEAVTFLSHRFRHLEK